MFSRYNPNPDGKRVGDCVVRALSKALDRSWDEIYIGLCFQGFIMSDMPSSNAVWGTYLKRNGFSRSAISDDCPECYCINDFALEHPNGEYVVGTGTHAVAVVDGCVYDAWDCLEERPIYFYYRRDL